MGDYVTCFFCWVCFAVFITIFQIAVFPLADDIDGMYRKWDLTGIFKNHYIFHVIPGFICGLIWVFQVYTRGTSIHFKIGRIYFLFYPIIIASIIGLYFVPTFSGSVPEKIATTLTLLWCVMTYLITLYHTFSKYRSRWGHKFWIVRHISVQTFIGWQRIFYAFLRSSFSDDLPTLFMYTHWAGFVVSLLLGELIVYNLKEQKMQEEISSLDKNVQGPGNG